jgi:hypothetical protein
MASREQFVLFVDSVLLEGNMHKLVTPALFFLGIGLQGQTPTPEPQPNVMVKVDTVAAPTIAMPAVPIGGVQFLAHEYSLPAGKPVTGAPYSADQVTEHVQTLADGNRIVNTTTTRMYRDAQGRTRTEVTLPGPANGAEQPKMITIDDVVSGSVYTLQPATKTAFRLPAPKLLLESKMLAESRSIEGPRGPATVSGFALGASEPPMPPPIPDGAGPWVITFDGNQPAPEVKKEDLGTQQVNGVSATGTRVTSTIPADAVGNEMPIQVVSETWYSPELRMVVKSTQNDPRMGQTTVTVDNISRTAPDASLFQVPSDYTISNHGPNMTFYHHTQKQQQ